jgi:hypothetical protein
MENLAEQPAQERQKSFDPLASVNMLRYDFEQFGQVLPETKQRVRDEELSYLVEGVGKAARTDFALRREGNDLVYFNKGQWQPYETMLQTGLEVAQKEATEDPRRAFLVDMAIDDQARGFAMRGLRPGEKITWTSPYRYQVANRYGDKFMNDCGLNSERKLGFICQATGTEDGIILQSQTVDLSDPDAFAVVDEALEADQQVDLDDLLELHDNLLERKFGEPHFAGRTETDCQENAWNTVLKQKDLITHLLDGLETIAQQSLPKDRVDKVTKRHIYGVWAAFKERLDGNYVPDRSGTHTLFYDKTVVVSYKHDVAAEVERAFNKFVSEGRVMVGCGGSISLLQGEEDTLKASGKEVHSAIFGGKACKEVKDGEITNCPSCKNRVKAIVPNRSKIFCSNDLCKLAAPGLQRLVKAPGDNTRKSPAFFSYTK